MANVDVSNVEINCPSTCNISYLLAGPGQPALCMSRYFGAETKTGWVVGPAILFRHNFENNRPL